jgi:hypothetical protein
LLWEQGIGGSNPPSPTNLNIRILRLTEFANYFIPCYRKLASLIFMPMVVKTKQPATLVLPLTGLKPLYRSNHGDKLVLEIDVGALKKVNEPNTIDEMVAEARLEYFLGKTPAFTDIKKLVKHLEA